MQAGRVYPIADFSCLANQTIPPTTKRVSMKRKKSREGQNETQTATRTDDERTKCLFAAFDQHGNRRITREDIRRISDDLGFEYSREELSDMIKFWDSSGTLTLSIIDFELLCDEIESQKRNRGAK